MFSNVTALNEALTAEVQRLKLATTQLNGESHYSVNPQMFQQQLQQPPPSQLNIHMQQQNSSANSNIDTKQ